MRNFLQLKVLPLVISTIIRLIRMTMRIDYLYREHMDKLIEKNKSFIFTFWHNRLVMMVYGYAGDEVYVLVSMHRDGVMTTNTLKYFGIKSIQGSSTRGAVQGLKKLIRITRTGADLGFTPDGPKGPPQKVKPGVIQAARLTGLPVLPVSFGSNRKWIFKSWDRLQLPKFFSRGVFVYGKPIYIERDCSRKDIERYCTKLEKVLNGLSEEADRYFK